jgi:N-acetyl-anhydromuramyl-L-alanine amidase AmpD
MNRTSASRPPSSMPHRPSDTKHLLGVALLGVGILSGVYVVTGLGPGPAMDVACEPGWRPRALSRRWTHIVIHHSATEAGGASQFDAYHRSKGWDELGYHFVIGNGTDTPDGLVEVGPRWAAQKRGAHCKTPEGYFNERGIGICLVGNFEHSRPTEAQLRSLGKLVRWLTHELRIAPPEIVGHGQVTGKTQCPGQYLDLADVRSAAQEVWAMGR